MTKCLTDISLRQAATIAGVGLLLMAVLAPIAEFSVHPIHQQRKDKKNESHCLHRIRTARGAAPCRS